MSENTLETLDDLELDVAKATEARVNLIKNINSIDGANELEVSITEAISTNNDILQVLRETIIIGAEPRMFEVASQLMNSLNANLREMRMLKKTVAETNIKVYKELIKASKTTKESGDQSNGNNGTVSLTPEQLSDMVLSARSKSELNSIDANFKTIEAEVVEDK